MCHPSNLIANGLWNHFTGKKKYEIECGNCLYTYSDKVHFAFSNNARSLCPACGVVNKWKHSDFQRIYDLQRGN